MDSKSHYSSVVKDSNIATDLGERGILKIKS